MAGKETVCKKTDRELHSCTSSSSARPVRCLICSLWDTNPLQLLDVNTTTQALWLKVKCVHVDMQLSANLTCSAECNMQNDSRQSAGG